MADLRQFKLPDVGEGLTEADIVRWHVQPGDTVEVNQIIVEIETAKAVVELPSPHEGVVSRLLVAEGDTVDVGTPIITFDLGRDGAPEPAAVDGGAAGQAAAGVSGTAPQRAHGTAPQRAHGTTPVDPPPLQTPTSADLVPPPPAEAAEAAGAAAAGGVQRQSVLVGYGVKLGSTTRRKRKTQVPPPGSNGGPPGTAAPVALAKPPVRKLARDLGVDLRTLTGTGPEGSITRADVEAATAAMPQTTVPQTQGRQPGGLPAGGPSAGGPQPGALTVPAAGPREERIPVRGVRKHTAAAVTASAFTAPHVTMFLQADVTETMNAVARLKALPDFDSIRVSPLLLVARAVIIAAARHPMINSSWDEAAQEIVVRRYVNLGVAAATDRGLLVPSVKQAQDLTLPELARAINEAAQTARAGRSAPADLADGTISITNVGVFGVDTGTPILPPGQAAILAFGHVKEGPWVTDGQLAVRRVTTLALSFDHRIVDGDLGSAVLRDIGAMLTDPLHMLAWS